MLPTWRCARISQSVIITCVTMVSLVIIGRKNGARLHAKNVHLTGLYVPFVRYVPVFGVTWRWWTDST
ncbi:hypothetical protein BGW80DRAFT_1321083 [Lactifluus volemus]|nr:hypothetical protein BGW80DRAFT_1321083 [Lactifluus volemus]